MARPLRKTHPSPPLYIGGQSGASSGDSGVIDGDLYVAGTATIIGTTTSADFVLDASGGGVPGAGSSAIAAQDEGTVITSDITSLDFVGAGVTATAVAGAVTVTVADPSFTEAVADGRYLQLTGGSVAGALGVSGATTLAACSSTTFSGPLTGNVTGNVSGSSGSTTGNAATATALQTGRAINGITFDGTTPITVTAAAGTLTGGTISAGVVTSSLTSVGTLISLAVTGAATFGSTVGASGNITALDFVLA